MMKDNKKSTFILQLTAMVDMFTIIIVFLLKSFSTSAVNITPQKGLTLPQSSSYVNPVEGIKLVISKSGIFVEDKLIVPLQDGQLTAEQVESTDNQFIKELFTALDKQAEKSKEISEQNKDYKFEGKIVMQADSQLDYGLLKKVMYTSSMAGYGDMKLATLAFE